MTDVLDRSALPDEPVLSLEPEAEMVAPSWDRQRDVRRGVEIAVSIVVVGGAVLFTLMQLHPGLLFSNTTPTGGDMGAHVWAPAYLRDNILSSFRLTGWSPDWYAGFPVYLFYMLPPALMVVLLDVVLPYGMALKIISAIGILALPVCCWAFGKLARMRFPIPPLLAVASVVFLFDETFQIYGGNIASTMAGEFSFSIALALSMLFFGVFSHSLRTGRLRPLAATLFALACLSHGIVMFFVAVGAVVLLLIYLLSALDSAAKAWAVVRVALPTLVVGGLLCAFWVFPFVLQHRFGTDMFYERNDKYWEMLFPQPLVFDWLLTGLALVGLLGSIVRRSRAGLFLGVMMLWFGAWAILQPQSLLWNNRLLPFMYLTRYMLAAIGILELGRAVARLINPDSKWLDWSLRVTVLAVASLGVWLALGMHFRVLPGGGFIVEDGRQVYAWPKASPISFKAENAGYVKYWAKWNYEGYEAKPAYGEYYGVVTTMQQIGEERGCGRALWENNNDQNAYGTPMSLMLLPFWTDGCIGSMEGLFFEASGTTPYHFIAASALSEGSSDPVRRLRYEKGDVDKGVDYLRALGVRYYLAYKPPIVALADANPGLERIAVTGPWHVYEVLGTELVTPLATQPVVVEGVDGRDRDPWLEVGTSWFQNQAGWAALPTDSGPSAWQRIEVEVVGDRVTDDSFLAEVAPATPIDPVELPPVVVSDVRSGTDSISFKVDRVGVPVLVRTSYFPNWQVDGGQGPYRAAPNFMVVVPTSNEVTLRYGYTGLEVGSYALTLLGVVGLIVLWRTGPIEMNPPPRRRRRRGVPPGRRQEGELDPTDPDPTDPDPTVVARDPTGPIAVASMVGPWAPPTATNGNEPFLLDWDEPEDEPDDEPSARGSPAADE